jgi:hypothetical protein
MDAERETIFTDNCDSEECWLYFMAHEDIKELFFMEKTDYRIEDLLEAKSKVPYLSLLQLELRSIRTSEP